jgi:hypothetical protein
VLLSFPLKLEVALRVVALAHRISKPCAPAVLLSNRPHCGPRPQPNPLTQATARLFWEPLQAELLAVQFAVAIALFADYVWRVRFACIDGYEVYQTFHSHTCTSRRSIIGSLFKDARVPRRPQRPVITSGRPFNVNMLLPQPQGHAHNHWFRPDTFKIRSIADAFGTSMRA